MRWPSKKSIMIGAASFVVGFAAAVALTSGFVAWIYTGGQSARQSWIVDPLVASTKLLSVADTQPKQLVRMIVGKSTEYSLTAAAQFDRFTKLNQQVVLRQFARLNRSASLRSDNTPYGKTARLARVMVLCSHASATPGWLTIDKNSGGMTPVPDWVLDPDAKPVLPAVGSIVGTFQQSPAVIAAELKHWGALHAWVIANQKCTSTQEAG